MRLLGNVLWHFPFFGFVNAIAVMLLGILLTVSIVAAPIGLGLIEYGKFLFWPFGREMVSKKDLQLEQNLLWKTYSTLVMIVYLPFGMILCVIAAFQVIGLLVSIIGIPAALVIAKSLGTYLNPVNKKCVPSAVLDEIVRRKAEAAVAAHLR